MDVGVVVLVGCFGKERNSGSTRFHQPWRLFYSQLLYYSYSLLQWFLSQIDTLFPSSYCAAIAAMVLAQEADPTNLEVLLALGVSHTNELEQTVSLKYLTQSMVLLRHRSLLILCIMLMLLDYSMKLVRCLLRMLMYTLSLVFNKICRENMIRPLHLSKLL
ncbi:uncharacterized protein [Gossypium hirsutum]|uniref:Cyclin C-terminal domain-containing protein n=1 Tax=Gossypium hirsutum TaxID=3635 RepID=A0ABM3AZK1_GOSHI|nr:uncharacterized protein LOC121223172 [Gossypium hirsutum]